MGLLNRDMINSELCIRAFLRMFWAFPFFLDFRIGINNVHVDILPDFIGWILMATALGWILGLHSDIKLIRTLSLILIFLSIFDLIEIKKKVSGISYDISGFFLIGIALTILSIIVIWKLCGVIMDMAEAADNSLIRERADFRRKLYLAFIIAITAAIGLCLVVPPLILVVAIVGFIIGIVVICLMMGLMKATANMCQTTILE